ncbi:gamma-glutamyltransferase [Polyangium fumosum]|uniref:Glutathione hydrolase proenzyme n=1 Tax=Polyangium fumosum TaxID=889272 RepID=A0A4V5PNC2_9BACT|nr:gamma-glutamyltransferase [Polyangium fumosum]TKD05002.1 gamma-glutamyltransferase [Polyangium fumosum]
MNANAAARRLLVRATFLVSSILAASCGEGAKPPEVPAVASSPAVVPALARVPAKWRFDLRAAPASGREGMVTSDAADATRVGVEILRKGGSAVDAAVGVAFALAVVFPQAGNIGGGGFMVVRAEQGEVRALDFRETAPAKATREMFFGKNDASLVGHLAAGVPGAVAGLGEAHRTYGKLPWKELVAPAIRFAEEGFVVDEGLAEILRDRAADIARFPASAAMFMPGGKPLGVGAVLKNPELAQVLVRIAERGAPGFYEGETANLLVEEMKAGGGIVTAEDLAAYRPVWRTPVEMEYRGHKVFAMPPPSSGGLVLAFSLGVLGGYDLGKMGFLSTEALHVTVETSRRAFAKRNHFLGDPAFVPVPTGEFLSAEAMEKARASIEPARATPSSEVGPGRGGADEKKHTTHFSIVDRSGAAVALTTTINTSLGSAVVVRGGGFLLNNEMDDFATEPGKPNVFGLVQGEANAVAPGKRMLSSMTPTIVVGPDGAVRIVTGAAGGPTIISAALAVITNVLDHGMGATAAVGAPRVHHQHLPDQIFIEEGGLPDDVQRALGARGHKFEAWDAIADAPSIVRGPGGVWTGAAEPRNKSGLALGL